MKDQSKTKQVLIQELVSLRKRIAEPEQSETERKQTEEALTESEEKFRTIFDRASDGILIADAQTMKFLQGNATICSMLGYTKKEIESLALHDIHPPKDISHVLDEFGKLIKGEKTLAEGLPVLRKDGSIFYADIGSTSTTIEGRHHLVGIFRDTTDRKQAEEALRESEERFRRLSEAAFEAIAIHEEGVLLNANDQFFKMFGYEPGEMLGKQVMPMTVALEAREFMTKQIATGGMGPYESIGLREDGTRFPMEIRVRQMEYKGRNVRVGVIRNITERRQAEEQLRLKTENLEEVNTALKVLLRQLEESKTELIGTMLSNIRELVLPHIYKLRDSSPSAYYISLLDIVETNINNIASSFLHQLKFKYYNLTPREIEVATLVKEGKSVKEIAALLNISISTVQFHRISLREKLGLKDRKTNLRSYLLSLH